MSRNVSWQLTDLVDFEHLLAQDAALPEDALRARDRALGTSGGDRRQAFRAWLDARRAQETGTLPGEALQNAWRLLIAITTVAGLVVGGSVSAAVLRHHGNEPVNITVFLGAILGPQFILPLLFGVLALLLRGRIGPLIVQRMLGIIDGWLRRLPGEQRQSMQVALATFDRRRGTYASLAGWPALIATQVFAVTFNIGAILALLMQVPTHELRFGWQTTLEVEPARVLKVMEVFASPWSLAPYALPSDLQIMQTRFTPGESLADLDGEAARSWWPFLAYSVACYGLLLRGAILSMAISKQHRALQRIHFDHVEANALWRRLSGPLMATEPTAVLAIPSSKTGAPEADGSGVSLILAAADCTASDAELAAALTKALGFSVRETVRVAIDNRQESAPQLARLRQIAPLLSAVIVAVPAERDPIVAIGLFLRDAVAAAGSTSVLIWLVGPSADLERRKYWRDFTAIQRLSIGVELAPAK